MAEFDFYCVQEEWLDLLREVVEGNGLRCVLDEWYPTPQAPSYSKVDQELIEKIVSGKRHVFLTGDFTTRGLFLDKQPTGTMAGRYAVNISYCGPAMELGLPTCYEEDGLVRISNGSLSHQSRYWNIELTESFEATPELRRAYGAVRDTLKRRLVRVDCPDPHWVSKDAVRLVREGRATLRIAGNWMGRSELSLA